MLAGGHLLETNSDSGIRKDRRMLLSAGNNTVFSASIRGFCKTVSPPTVGGGDTAVVDISGRLALIDDAQPQPDIAEDFVGDAQVRIGGLHAPESGR